MSGRERAWSEMRERCDVWAQDLQRLPEALKAFCRYRCGNSKSPQTFPNREGTDIMLHVPLLFATPHEPSLPHILASRRALLMFVAIREYRGSSPNPTFTLWTSLQPLLPPKPPINLRPFHKAPPRQRPNTSQSNLPTSIARELLSGLLHVSPPQRKLSERGKSPPCQKSAKKSEADLLQERREREGMMMREGGFCRWASGRACVRFGAEMEGVGEGSAAGGGEGIES